MRVTLQVTEGPHAGQTFSFQGHETFLVGRSRRAHLQLPARDMFFSRIHFLVEINPPQCRLLDMGSRNGTFVNGERVESVDLHDGDQIRAGHTMFTLRLIDEDRPETVSRSTATPVPTMLTAQARRPSSTTLPGSVKPTTGSTTPQGVPPPPPPPPPPPTPSSAPTAPIPPPPTVPELRPATVRTNPPSGPLAPCAVCGAKRETVPALPIDWAPHPLDGRMCDNCLQFMCNQDQRAPGYRILREIGRGGMGIVFLASRDRDGHYVAIKTITPTVQIHPNEVTKFLREADILRQLDHPNIVRFLDMNGADGYIWFAMDFIAGIDAARLLKKQGPLSVSRAVSLVTDLLKALEYAHERGFVHRDIKPGNLLVTQRNNKEVAVLADFGLARVYQSSQLSGLTVTGAMGGTPMFMPPEQITQYREARPPADQYAAAMTLYNLLTGTYGFDTPAQYKQWITLILEEEPVPLLQRRPDLPATLANIVHRALHKDPQRRFPDVRVFRKALKPFLPAPEGAE